MRLVVLLACVCYWLFLTVLLLVPSPATLIGLQTVPVFPWGKFGVHLIAFTILGFLVNATRWPKQLWWPMIAFVMGYGVTAEALQLFVPHRTSRVMDGIENLLGIALGSAVVLALAAAFGKTGRGSRRRPGSRHLIGGPFLECGGLPPLWSLPTGRTLSHPLSEPRKHGVVGQAPMHVAICDDRREPVPVLLGPVTASYGLPITIVMSLISWPGSVSIPESRMSCPPWRIFSTSWPSFCGENSIVVCPGIMP